ANAVQCLCDEPRRRGLAHATNSSEQKGMRDSATFDRIGERLDHRILADQLRKGLRTVFARENAIGRRIDRLWRLLRNVEAQTGRFGVVHLFSFRTLKSSLRGA